MATFDVAAYLPEHVAQSSHQSHKYATTFKQMLETMLPSDKDWIRRQPTLAAHGYRLRSRYEPGWTPSWYGTNVHPVWCEDSITAKHSCLMDAARVSDGRQVAIKVVEGDATELQVLQALALDSLHNHCIPVFEVLPDPLNPSRKLMVTPYLYPFDAPKFETVAEVLDFVSQTLQGLRFMHTRDVTHGNCYASNIMIDSRPLYPTGRHPIRHDYTLDAMHHAIPLPRKDNPVRYYFVSFGNAVAHVNQDNAFVWSSSEDVAALGNLYKEAFLDKYSGLYFLKPLVAAMTYSDLDLRATASEACTLFNDIISSLPDTSLDSAIRLSVFNTVQGYIYNAGCAILGSFPSLW